MLHPKLAELRDRLYEKAYDAHTPAGKLGYEWAERLGLPANIPIAIGAMDVHYGAVGCGIQEGVLVKVIGTSSCDCAVVSPDLVPRDIPGIPLDLMAESCVFIILAGFKLLRLEPANGGPARLDLELQLLNGHLIIGQTALSRHQSRLVTRQPSLRPRGVFGQLSQFLPQAPQRHIPVLNY